MRLLSSDAVLKRRFERRVAIAQAEKAAGD